MATVTLPTQGQTPWDGTLNAAITAINDEVENHEERIEVLEAGGGGGSTAWADITGKPSTFPPTIGSSGTTAVAGNDARLTDQRTPSDNSVTSAKIVNGTIVDADINASAAIAQSKVANLTTDLAAKAADNAVVKLTGDQTVAGVKTFTDGINVPDNSLAISDVSGLAAALTLKPTAVYAPTTARPSTSGPVLWIGYSSQPANAITNDLVLQLPPGA